VWSPIQPTVISLFAGCGGSSCGYRKAGYRELLAVEYNKSQAKLFKMNFPEVPLWFGDIHKLSVDEIKQITKLKEGELDVLDGSPPCQGFSIAQGRKRKLEDQRNQLFNEYIRILRGLKPKVFVAENVAGLTFDKMKFVFNYIFTELKNSGYRVRCKLLNAANYEVPQKRKRVIFIGVREDLELNPSYPEPQKNHNGIKRLDEKKSKFLSYRWDDHIVKENDLIGTITKQSRFFWSKDREFGVKSYSYASSFPNSYIWLRSHEKSKDGIGNSVPPMMMFYIANHVKAILVKSCEINVH
jgi:DNA (cytosine-5)-methyltransferase 1